MIGLMVVIIFFYLFGGMILSFLGTAIPVAVGGLAALNTPELSQLVGQASLVGVIFLVWCLATTDRNDFPRPPKERYRLPSEKDDD